MRVDLNYPVPDLDLKRIHMLHADPDELEVISLCLFLQCVVPTGDCRTCPYGQESTTVQDTLPSQ